MVVPIASQKFGVSGTPGNPPKYAPEVSLFYRQHTVIKVGSRAFNVDC